jgi:hypothetical protein
MTQYQFDPSALLDEFHDRPDLDLVREMVGFLYQTGVPRLVGLLGGPA